MFYRPTSFSFALNVYILSIVYLYLQLWCPFEEGDLNIICFVLNTDLFYGFCFYFIYSTTLALCLWSSSIKSMFLNTLKTFSPYIHFEFEIRYRPTPPCLKAKEVYNVKKQTNKETNKKKTQLKLANTCLPSFIIGHHMGKSDHYVYAVTIHLGIFLLFRDIISSKTSGKNITTTRCTHWYKSIETRYGLNCATHSIKYPHLRELSSSILPCESVETK